MRSQLRQMFLYRQSHAQSMMDLRFIWSNNIMIFIIIDDHWRHNKMFRCLSFECKIVFQCDLTALASSQTENVRKLYIYEIQNKRCLFFTLDEPLDALYVYIFIIIYLERGHFYFVHFVVLPFIYKIYLRIRK